MLRNFHRPAGLLAATGLATCLAAAAQGPRERPRYVLQALDLDHDGTLSAAEIQAAPAALRSRDRNGDGELTADEMEAPRTDAGASPDQLVTQLMSFDRNGDGVLTSEELPERLRPLLVRGDTNHDGKLTAAEIRETAQRNGTPNGPRTRPGSAGGMMRQDPILSTLDADHDGVLSAQEIAAAGTNLLALDANHDGTITADEMRVRQQTPKERVDHMLGEWDTDKDGKLSKAEVPDGLRARFDDNDTNHDGFLDAAELQTMFANTQGGAPGAPQQKGSHN